MSGVPRRRPSAAMLVAIVALVVALNGTAFAGPVAQIAKKLINGSSIKKHSIPGNRLKNHTLTGNQINLAKLGTVPTASNANALGGAPPSAYLSASKLLRWSFTMNKGAAARAIGSLGPLTLTATCAADGTKTNATVSATTTESNTFISTNPGSLPGGTTISPGTSFPIVSQDTATANDGNSNALAAFDAQGGLAVFSTAQTFGVAINTPGADCRFFGYLINDA